jgi:hypothetical protein
MGFGHVQAYSARLLGSRVLILSYLYWSNTNLFFYHISTHIGIFNATAHPSFLLSLADKLIA